MSNVTKRSWKLFALCVTVAVAFVAIDLGTKQWAQSRLSTARGEADRQAICQPSASGVILPQRIPSDRIDIIRGRSRGHHAAVLV